MIKNRVTGTIDLSYINYERLNLMSQDSPPLTPMMQQWFDCKESAKESILLFRLGDFYESFYEDAEVLAKTLNLTLTKRQNIPMAGVPQISAESYIERLVSKGFRVAIAEQVGDPKTTKGIVKREVSQIITPATILSENVVPAKENNFIVSIFYFKPSYSIAVCDISTGLFFTSSFTKQEHLLSEIHKLSPKEILYSAQQPEIKEIINQNNIVENALIIPYAKWKYEKEYARNSLKEQFQTPTLEGFGIESRDDLIIPAGALLAYFKEELTQPTSHIQTLSVHQNNHYLSMDCHTLSNLEILQPSSSQHSKFTLFSALDNTRTPMGGRLLAHWLRYPLTDPLKIKERQDGVAEIIHKSDFNEILSEVLDIERLAMKLASYRITPRELISLKQSVISALDLESYIENYQSPIIKSQWPNITNIKNLLSILKSSISDPAPAKLGEGLCFQPTFNTELRQLIHIKQNSKDWIREYQERIKSEIGIKNLKIGFNRTFGYYIEVSKSQSDKVPSSYHRKQTLVNAERFISEELKDFEQKILSAEEKIQKLENQLYTQLLVDINKYTSELFQLAKAVATIDVIHSFAQSALNHNYTRPIINNSQSISIKNGRHPVVEKMFADEPFIPNDTFLDATSQQMMLITGPNMAGKSTYIRQVALLVLMAQTGSYIPASSSEIGIVDQIFTRIGASDKLCKGLSTFMVEMTETANILNNATDRSLIILDEIGRGTSTYDGISIARAVAEYILTTPRKQAKTLFATHYFELLDLAKTFEKVTNYTVEIKESQGKLLFMRKVHKGTTDKSYGIHVAQLAGMPKKVIQRAKGYIKELEGTNQLELPIFPDRYNTKDNTSKEKNILTSILEIDTNNISPINALIELDKIKKNIASLQEDL